jgi:transposase
MDAVAPDGPRALDVSPESRRTLATASMSGSASAASTAALAAAWGSSTSVLTAKSADTPNSLGVWRRWWADVATVHTAIAPVTARAMPRTPDHAAARARSPAGLTASRTPNAI